MDKASATPVSRRRLIKAGASAAPVLMTIASRPVLGTACMNVSVAAGSLDGSILRTTSTCTGCTPSYWSSTATWPTPYDARGPSSTEFHSTITGFNKGANANFGTRSMMHVLNRTDTSAAYEVGGYIAAAILNARMGYTPVLSEDTVRRIWNEYAATGTFQPTAGVTWSGNQIVAYIKTTMA